MKSRRTGADGVIAVLVIFAVFLAAARAAAGVVLEEQVTRESGAAQEQTLIVQGNKQKQISGPGVVVTDLDRGLITVSNSAAKVFAQRPLFLNSSLRPRSSRRSTRDRTERLDPQQPMVLLLLAKFSKTGNQRKVADYGCDEYAGAAHLPEGDYSLTVCFSTSAPGAAEFSRFMRTLMAREYPQIAGTNALPAGIPLSLVSTLKRRAFPLPAWMPPEQIARAKEILARPIITKTVVTKLASQSVSASAFEPPTGYRRIGAPLRPSAATRRAPAVGTAPSPPKPPSGAERKPNARPT